MRQWLEFWQSVDRFDQVAIGWPRTSLNAVQGERKRSLRADNLNRNVNFQLKSDQKGRKKEIKAFFPVRFEL